MPTINLSQDNLVRLIAAYRRAVIDHEPSFKFEGVEFLTAYAYYFIKHWAPLLKVNFDD